MLSVVRRVVISLALLPFTAAPKLRAQSDNLVSIRELTPQEHRTEAFVISAPQTVRIEAVGAEPRQDRRWRGDDRWWNSDDNDARDVWPAAAWIIDARTREVVWDIRTVQNAAERDRNGVRRYSGTVRLPAGTYIAHYASFVATSTNYNGNLDVNNIGSFLRGLRQRRDRRVTYSGPYVDDGSYREFQLMVRGDGRRATARELEDAGRASEAVIATLRPDSTGGIERYAFELDRATDVEVSGLGEMMRDNVYDYGWIQNADTRRRVWTMEYRRSEDAGGSHKNRSARETLHLGPGRYVAYFVSDDSHDAYEWNAVPPIDPDAWGLTLRVADAAARARIRPWNYEPVPATQTIVSLVGVRDDELRSEGFTLRRPLDVRIYALGEGSNPDGYSRDDTMDDYAWIVDVNTRRRVWTMGYDNTEHAGGATKNRVFDGVVRLEAGSYMVYYKSDGSHSFGDWNDAAPPEGRYWGVSVLLPSGDRSAVVPFERPRSNAIVELTRMRDGVRARRSFELDQEQAVRVYAIGEGDGQMYDYGWIEDANGRTVWEMTYRMTQHAGGARKNRVFDGTVRLPAGRYTLRWEADDSHSFGDWNDDPPDDPEAWGITILPARP